MAENVIEDETKRAMEMGKTYEKKLREKIKGLAVGFHTMTDLQFRAWFEMKVQGKWVPDETIDPMTGQPKMVPVTGPDGQPMVDEMGQPQMQPAQKFVDGPNWARALAFAKGGADILRRYERVVRDMDGIDLRGTGNVVSTG